MKVKQSDSPRLVHSTTLVEPCTFKELKVADSHYGISISVGGSSFPSSTYSPLRIFLIKAWSKWSAIPEVIQEPKASCKCSLSIFSENPMLDPLSAGEMLFGLEL